MIKFDNISMSYGDVKALKGISLEVNSNELFGLIGPDGAGKTSLIRILVSLLLPESGSVEMNGLDVVSEYKKVRRMVGYMPGRFSLYQDLTVEENLNFFASVFGTTIQENYHLIEGIYKQIEPFKNRRAGKLSGGMKQKLALSCALIHKPEILVLDEPTTGVDAVSRREFWDILDYLKSQGITIFVSTPYMDEASRCDRVALIQNGEIMTVDEPAKIVQHFGKNIWKVKSDNTYQLLTDLSAWSHTEAVYPFGQFLHLTPNEKVSREMVEEFIQGKQHGNMVIEAGFSGIEDVFMDLMSRN
ncbi:MAG: ABC transporter ATP-binding protein [Prolixibacteraceae bacterium]